MFGYRNLRTLTSTLIGLGALALTFGQLRSARACRVVEVEFTPTKSLQMVVWVEDEAGNYVDTLFVTSATGTYGIGNRPGLYSFNSGDNWPYGRRNQVLPVWAHKRNVQYPQLVFQDADDTNLSHALSQSSNDQVFCRPTLESEIHEMDMMSCPTLRTYTDKGRFDPAGKKSLYPPRNDLVNPMSPPNGVDHPDAKMFSMLNELDMVSKPTPPGGMRYKVRWPIPEALAQGTYRIRIETNKERDENAFHANCPAGGTCRYPAPTLPSWGEYGVPVLGQPSVVWTVPIAIDSTARVAHSLDYEGYGDPHGMDGDVSPADSTITTGVEGSGAGRLAVGMDGATNFRVKVSTQPGGDTIAPGAPSMLQAPEVHSDRATIEFLAPGGNGDQGEIAGYEVRMRAGEPIVTEADFIASQVVEVSTAVAPAGQKRTIQLTGLLPRTNYFVAVRASDGCLNVGPLATLKVTTPDAVIDEPPPDEGCFIATAAWGSLLAPNVQVLRNLRDRVLKKNLLGQTFITTYYTFSPTLAATIRHRPTLRAMVRGALEPVVEISRALTAP